MVCYNYGKIILHYWVVGLFSWSWYSEQNTTFRKLDLLPSSGENGLWGGEVLYRLSWADYTSKYNGKTYACYLFYPLLF